MSDDSSLMSYHCETGLQINEIKFTLATYTAVRTSFKVSPSATMNVCTATIGIGIIVDMANTQPKALAAVGYS